MPLFSSLAALLLISLFTGSDKNLTKGDADIEPPSNNSVKNEPGAEQFTKRETPWSCGEVKVYNDPMKRDTSRTYDDEDFSYDPIDEASNLDKILGGTYVSYGDVPFQVSILRKGTFICGGAIINEYWIITAAHCVSQADIPNLKFVVGDYKLGYKDRYEVEHVATDIIRHERFKVTRYGQGEDNDIALVKVKGNLRADVGIWLNEYVQPICLPKVSEIPKAGRILSVTGWGQTAEGGGPSEILKKVFLPLLHMDYCLQYYADYVVDNALCLGYPYISHSAVCKGDSGGPVVIDTRDGKILIGIVSSGSGCNPPIRPTVLTSVPKYRTWIDKTIKKYSWDDQGVIPNRSYSILGPMAEGELY